MIFEIANLMATLNIEHAHGKQKANRKRKQIIGLGPEPRLNYI